MLLEALDREVIDRSPEQFYYLSRAIYVKDEGLLDRFDQVFNKVFKGIISTMARTSVDVPADWLKAVAEKFLTLEEMAAIESLGDWDKIMETLKERLEEQQKRHEGGSKWIGTGGTSPFGNSGYNPEGVRIGGESKHKPCAQSLGKARVPESRQHQGTRHPQHQDRAPPPAQVRARGCGGRTRYSGHDRRHRAAGLARHQDAPRAAQRGQAAAVPRRRRVDGPVHQALRGTVQRRDDRVQASRILLLPQLPVRRRVEG